MPWKSLAAGSRADPKPHSPRDVPSQWLWWQVVAEDHSQGMRDSSSGQLWPQDSPSVETSFKQSSKLRLLLPNFPFSLLSKTPDLQGSVNILPACLCFLFFLFYKHSLPPPAPRKSLAPLVPCWHLLLGVLKQDRLFLITLVFPHWHSNAFPKPGRHGPLFPPFLLMTEDLHYRISAQLLGYILINKYFRGIKPMILLLQESLGTQVN